MRNIIYLAGAITGISWKEATEWRNDFYDVISKVCSDDWFCFDPCDHFNEFGEVISNTESLRYDLDYLRHSRLMVVNFKNIQKSIGTMIELGVAYENKIPIIGFNPDSDGLSPWLVAISTHICDSYQGLMQFLCDHYLNEV